MREQSQPHPRTSQSGFTLIELMIASLISIVLSFTMVQLMSMSFSNAQVSQATQSINYTGQQAAELLSAVIRKSGYEGCKPPSALTLATGSAINPQASALTFLADPDTTQFPISDFSAGAFQGFKIGPGGAISPPLTTQMNAALSTSPTPKNNTAMFAVYYASQAFDELAAGVPTPTTEIELDGNTLNLSAGEYAFIGDCQKSTVFSITNVTGGSTPKLQHNGINTGFSDNAKVRRALYEFYYVGDTTRLDGMGNPVHALYRIRNGVAEEIIPNIGALELRYVTRDATGAANYYDDFTAIAADEYVEFVQLGIMVIGEKPVLSEDDTQNYEIFDLSLNTSHALLAGYTRNLKKVYTLDILLRNKI